MPQQLTSPIDIILSNLSILTKNVLLHCGWRTRARDGVYVIVTFSDQDFIMH